MGYYFFLIVFYCTAAWFIAMDESVAKAFIYVYDYVAWLDSESGSGGELLNNPEILLSGIS